MVYGVCVGIAEYFSIDPTTVQLAWVLLCALGDIGILIYVIVGIITPRSPQYLTKKEAEL